MCRQNLILYIAIQYLWPRGLPRMNSKNDRMREQIVLAMLEEFPTLKKKIKSYLEEDPKK